MSDKPDQDENRLIAERRQHLDALREAKQAFPNQFRREHYADDLQREHGHKSKEDLVEENIQVSIAGRIMLNRGAFMVLQDMSGRIQLYVNKGARPFAKALDLGDIVGISGQLHKSGQGDLYVDMGDYFLLTKSLRPLPDKHKGLQDTELRYRQRYLDLIINEESRRVFEIRARVVAGIRGYLSERRFIEVETPMLHLLPGGASARPFSTHHHALDLAMYLRIAPELYLKRLVVGGFERVFEINRNFRNEGLSTRHNPEFTMLEFYQAYADYKDLMDLTEDLLRTLAKDILGSQALSYKGKTYDLSKSFKRVSLFDSILEHNPELKSGDIDNLEAVKGVAKALSVPIEASYGLGKVQLEIFEKTVEHRLDKPTFITAYPSEVSPLARPNDDNDFLCERFELFVAGREIANGFSELNDPEAQVRSFQAQLEAKQAGDEEAMHFDSDYITALEHGMPPTAGEGIGIDRLVMLFADCESIRDVILFPAMRPEN